MGNIKRKYRPIAECEVCRELGEVQTSFYKHGWPEQTRGLPVAAGRLVPDPDEEYGSRKTIIQRCPVCGMHYKYRLDYDYDVTGSEDEETLSRLTPVQARKQMSQQEYDWWMEHLEQDKDHPDEKTRLHARRAMADHQEAEKARAARRSRARRKKR